MTRICKLALIAVAAVSVASPVLAQSQHRVAMHKGGGLDAFAMAPGAPGGSAFSPAGTGGGSIGYNEHLRHDTW